ncbi:N-acetylneuraminate 9-O-acetyltransferase [Clonorchis sinensis]|uniref:N-acetylneuraminate 9-O-acetyltransferase n=2 Tax=Clonorchis sinensis TaxID=79923 RepID=A0A8T1MXE3_CLOSI|nr:N-acetylneuraminate 9-O-acetyltransferase [Clonorchis sinensis]
MTIPVHATHTVTSVCNFKTAKAFAFFIMLFFSIYHGSLMFNRPGGNLCKSLLSDGSAGPGGEWRPYGCMTHIYNEEDSNVCMEQLATWGDHARVYFMGDSRLFNLFSAFAHHLDTMKALKPRQLNNRTGLSTHVKSTNYELCFLHYDEITADVLHVLDAWKAVHDGSSIKHLRLRQLLPPRCLNQPPTHLVLSFGSQTILRVNNSEIGLLDYNEKLESSATALSSLSFVRTVWMLQDPVAEGLLKEEHTAITNKELDAYNNIAEKVMQRLPEVEIWRSNRLIAQRMGFPAVNWHCPSSKLSVVERPIPNRTSAVEPWEPPVLCTEPPPLSDGFHVSAEAMFRNVQVLLNLYCNNQMKFEDGTCCRSAEPITPVQQRCFIFIGLCVIASVLCFIYDTFIRSRISRCRWLSIIWLRLSCCLGVRPTLVENATYAQQLGSRKLEATTTFQEFYELVTTLSQFGLILVYFFICDRTVLFMKTNKGFTTMSFLLPMTYLFVLGLFFSGPTKETRLNHVDITREWKGWMQLYLLVYHFTGSYRVLPLRLFTRFFTSAYLFLSGFGHFYCLWHHPLPGSLIWEVLRLRFSLQGLYFTAQAWWAMLRRYVDVVFRLNFLVLGLCLVMNRDYMFYHFMPLVTFWFTVTMVVMLIIPRVSASDARNPSSFSSVRDSSSLLPVDSLDSIPSELKSPVGMNVVSPYVCDCDFDSKSSPTSPYLSECRHTRKFGFNAAELPKHLRASQSSSSIDGRSHQKALSMGTGFDLRQWLAMTQPVPLNEPRTKRKSKVLTNSGPPWTEDLIRRVWSTTSVASNMLPTVPTRRTFPESILSMKRYCCCFHVRLADLLILFKIILLIVGIELLYRSPSFFHFVFFSGVQRFLFQSTAVSRSSFDKPTSSTELRGDDAWFYRWSIDRYSVVYGILFALACEWARRAKCLNDLKSGDLGLPAPPAEFATPLLQAGTIAAHKATSDRCGETLNRFTFDHLNLETSQFVESSLANKPSIPPASSNGSVVNSSTSTRLNPSSGRLSFYTSPQYSISTFQTMGSGFGFLSKITCRRFTAVFLTVLGAIGIGVYILISFQCKDHGFCTEVHTFLCLLPIISYILLRNCLGLLRRSHSTLFAWFGDISLELYVAQHHIWLSADANGILVLLPGYPLFNLALTSFVFVCVCCELRNITTRLRRLLIPNSALLLLRNLILFSITLHLITRSPGLDFTLR